MRGFVDVLEGVVALILQLELKAAKLAEALYGGRFEGDDEGAGDSEELRAQATDKVGGGVLFAFALRVGAEREKDETGVGGVASEAEAGDGERAFDLGEILGDGLDLTANVAGVLE